MATVPPQALPYGFAPDGAGTLSGKTLMLPELRALLAARPADESAAGYSAAILEDNVLLKPTATTRLRSRRHLREWYALDPALPLFRALRALWDADPAAQPLLTLLCAAARNAVLRATTEAVLQARPGDVVTPSMLVDAAARATGAGWNETTRGSIGRNAAASWQQSGHLAGRLVKTRSRAVCLPAATTYALLLGHLCGLRGDQLFTTLWARLLDAPEYVLREQAATASQGGWLEYRHAGGVTEVGFRHLLGPLNENEKSGTAGATPAGAPGAAARL